jgi:hypothetical protein
MDPLSLPAIKISRHDASGERSGMTPTNKSTSRQVNAARSTSRCHGHATAARYKRADRRDDRLVDFRAKAQHEADYSLATAMAQSLRLIAKCSFSVHSSCTTSIRRRKLSTVPSPPGVTGGTGETFEQLDELLVTVGASVGRSSRREA